MKIKLDYKNLPGDKKTIAHARYLADRLSKQEELDIDLNEVDMVDIPVLTELSGGSAKFAVWIEVDSTKLANDIPLTLSFAQYIDENEITVRRKWGDLSLLKESRDGAKSLRYLTGVTDQISMADLAELQASPMRVLNAKTRQIVLKDPGDIYLAI